jgi:hypothetical protein
VTRGEANVVFEKAGFNFELQLLSFGRAKTTKKKWRSEEQTASSKSCGLIKNLHVLQVLKTTVHTP